MDRMDQTKKPLRERALEQYLAQIRFYNLTRFPMNI